MPMKTHSIRADGFGMHDHDRPTGPETMR